MTDAPPVAAVGRGEADAAASAQAHRTWWDAAAEGYQEMHGDFLGDADFLWCPEGLRESAARLLGDVAGHWVLEVGCGAAQCSRWLRTQGAHAVGIDISAGQLGHARALDGTTSIRVPVVQADAQRLPFAAASFDLACSAFGGVPFVADSAAVMREVARVLRPGGRWVFSVTHPIRWIFPDDPGTPGLTVTQSYFDRTPYVETDEEGDLLYVEHHRTFGDRVQEITAAGLVLQDVVEPPWPPGHERAWGQFSPLRGRLMPGTAIFVCGKPASGA
ncbi:MAG TPA: methyltransferase domain-containing protein [Mycobacteriales bacterium]|nr:methyltransferase domain-containing protein [Mycobacteriales bacterium]